MTNVFSSISHGLSALALFMTSSNFEGKQKTALGMPALGQGVLEGGLCETSQLEDQLPVEWQDAFR